MEGFSSELLALAGKVEQRLAPAFARIDQRALLNALCPYISRDRINRLERAMRAAKLASFASGFLNKSGLLQGIGR